MEELDLKNYSTDGKTQHLSTEEDVNTKLSKIIGEKFINYKQARKCIIQTSLINNKNVYFLNCW